MVVESLSAFDRSGKKLWTKAKTTVDTNLYPDAPSPSYCDLELDGKTIWAACACDAVGGKATKALVKLSTEEVHDTSWQAEADPASWRMSLVKANKALYLGTGAATTWPSTTRRPEAPAAGGATPQARRRRLRSMTGS